MKIKIILATLMMVSHLIAYGTQVPYKELRDIVSESDHVIIGTVTNVLVRDANDNFIADPQARTGRNGNDMCLFVRRDPEGILKSSGSDVPNEFCITYGGIFFLMLSMEQEQHIEKKYIFLLKGQEFAPTYHMLSFRPLEERAQIEQFLRNSGADPAGDSFAEP